MEKEYDVLFGDKTVGKAQVTKQGLYFRLRVRCELSPDVMFRLLLNAAGQEFNLGILVPKDGQFGLDTRIAAAKTGDGNLRFRVLPRHGALRGRFVPLAPEEPFGYLTRLKDAYLTNRNGVVGVVIKEPGCE